MIEHLSGTVLTRLPHALIVDVNGVGYGVELPLSALCDAPAPGEKISLWIETYVREDALKLYGFTTFDDRQAFAMLRSVSGVGPKIALAILSTLDAKSLRHNILQNRVQVLESVPGIGRRTAERLILELKPKMEKMSFATPGLTDKSPQKSPRSAATAANLASSDTDLDFDLETSSSTRIDQLMTDLRSALENLGYKDKEIMPVVTSVLKQHRDDMTQLEFPLLLKSALKTMRSGL